MVIVDTNVIIASIRGNEVAQQLIRKYLREIRLSAVTEMELYIGATNPTKKEIVKQVLQTHEVLPLTKPVAEVSLKLIKTYNTKTKSLFLADALIAATCLTSGASLLTFNTSDFKFIKGLRLAN